MSKRNSDESDASLLPVERSFSAQRRNHLWIAGMLTAALLITGGVFAKNGWFPSTDPFTGKKTGWFGKPLAKNASGIWNPLAAPLPTPTPQLSREYVYAGSRLLAQVDANAQEAPPADLAVWRPSTGGWWVMGGQLSASVTQNWGTSGDDPVEGDYDGDGKTDFAVFRPTTGYWYIVKSSDSTTVQYPFGQTTDIPAQADYNGDGQTESALFRPSTGTWYIRTDGSGSTVQQQFGLSTDAVAPADYDGDGKADIGVWRESDKTFYSLNSSNQTVQSVGMSPQGGVPVSSDYDGDGKADYAVRNGATWAIRKSSDSSTYTQTPSGDLSTDEPVQNDYDGDGKTDIAVWRSTNGNLYIRQSASGSSLRQVQWGISGDVPVPALYRL